jgi:hypothetical protein
MMEEAGRHEHVPYTIGRMASTVANDVVKHGVHTAQERVIQDRSHNWPDIQARQVSSYPAGDSAQVIPGQAHTLARS